ncbi:hypothetical protein HTVC041P_gp2 [Pelagibacter phage HTVC041P]|uniref:Uncharacterized protein n=1 Tax=Pelagibacter phage HTVC041P TaxID=3072833 RepID=A0AAX4G2M5_9CAUD|nr:hypothetical protein HTVC041P_gp2 [Pelagibacter phage HTVC041P]
MSVYIIETPTNSMVCKCQFLFTIRLHKSPDLSDEMKKQVRKLKVGEAVKFPNGLKVKKFSQEQVTNLVTYIKRRKLNKDRTNDSSSTSL